MPQKVRIALDAMGGDVGASVVIPGAAISLKRHPDTEFLLYGDSKLIDPLTGKERKISGTPLGNWEAVLRQDVPGTDLSWGAGVEHNTRSSVYRFDQRSRSFSGAFAFAFVEHKDLFGLKVRLQAANLTDRTEGGRREVYVGDRLGPLNFIEEREQTFSQIFRLQISDTF